MKLYILQHSDTPYRHHSEIVGIFSSYTGVLDYITNNYLEILVEDLFEPDVGQEAEIASASASDEYETVWITVWEIKDA